ncbi:hypothetical protein J2X68_007230 [Streptomyces sp. 3330]|nr:hypothetical protein [Streptomyces sp. 3330]MDR6980490.1 hypothetical protein [Streptomyces sp. 3330]
MASQEELFASVDALLAEEPQLPSPAERQELGVDTPAGWSLIR